MQSFIPRMEGLGFLTITAANETLSESLTNVASGSDHENIDHFGGSRIVDVSLVRIQRLLRRRI